MFSFQSRSTFLIRRSRSFSLCQRNIIYNFIRIKLLNILIAYLMSIFAHVRIHAQYTHYTQPSLCFSLVIFSLATSVVNSTPVFPASRIFGDGAWYPSKIPYNWIQNMRLWHCGAHSHTTFWRAFRK